MASGSWAREALSAGMAMTRDAFGVYGYLRAHPEVDQDAPPSTLPSDHGEVVELYEWTEADEAAQDWRLA